MSLNLMNSLNNHLKMSYSDACTDRRQKPEDVWNFALGAASRPVVEWRAELVLAAIQIQGYLRTEPLLYIDGSYGSQVMAQAFRWTGKPFSCVVPRYKKDLNLQAFSESILFLENIEAPYEIMEIDLEETLNSPETLEWTVRYSTDSVPQMVAMKVWQSLAERTVPVIFPVGLPILRKTTEGWKVLEFEKEYGLFQFQNDHKLPGVSNFFKWSPELIMGFLQDPLVRSLMTNVRKETAVTDQVLKEILQNYFPIVGSKNWTGLERAEFTVKRFHQATRANYKGAFSAYSYAYADYCARINYTAPVETHSNGPSEPTFKASV